MHFTCILYGQILSVHILTFRFGRKTNDLCTLTIVSFSCKIQKLPNHLSYVQTHVVVTAIAEVLGRFLFIFFAQLSSTG